LLTQGSPEACRFRCVSGLVHGLGVVAHGPQQVLVLTPSMHFGYYLMIAALVLIGLEVLYRLYQLATFL
jgi:hypothetical protein